MKKENGFTLIELMVTLVVAVVLVTVAIPNFSALVKNNRLATNANAFVSALHYARSEAIKQRKTITLTSNNSTNWHTGWTVKEGSTLLRTQNALKAGSSLTTGSASTIQYNSRGALSGASNLVFDVCDNRTGETGVRITISAIGRPSNVSNPCT